MDLMPILLLTANFLSLVWALKLLGRQPNRRLRHLVLTVCVVSVSQTVAFLCHLQGQSLLQAASALQQCVTSMGTMAAVYLLWVEIRDRNRTDQMLRLAEHENQVRSSRAVRTIRESVRAAEQGR
jgi:arginine exporter protein ArgO